MRGCAGLALLESACYVYECAQEDLPVREPTQLVQNLGSDELEYLLQKLVVMTIHQSCLAAQHQATSKEVQAKMEQVRERM